MSRRNFSYGFQWWTNPLGDIKNLSTMQINMLAERGYIFKGNSPSNSRKPEVSMTGCFREQRIDCAYGVIFVFDNAWDRNRWTKSEDSIIDGIHHNVKISSSTAMKGIKRVLNSKVRNTTLELVRAYIWKYPSVYKSKKV